MFACRTTVLLWSGACCCNRNSPNDLLYCSQSRSADKMKFKFCRNDRLTFPCRTTVLPWSSARCGKRNSWNGLLYYSHSRSTEKIKLNFWTKNSCLAVEPDDTLFHYCSAALHQMIRLRKETLQHKKGCGKVSTERCLIMEKELELLNTLVMKDEVVDGVLKLWFPSWRIHESTNSWMLKFRETSKFPGKLLMQTRCYGQNFHHILWLPNEKRWTCS